MLDSSFFSIQVLADPITRSKAWIELPNWRLPREFDVRNPECSAAFHEVGGNMHSLIPTVPMQPRWILWKVFLDLSQIHLWRIRAHTSISHTRFSDIYIYILGSALALASLSVEVRSYFLNKPNLQKLFPKSTLSWETLWNYFLNQPNLQKLFHK